jgi:Tfp pilus assembly protein PilP
MMRTLGTLILLTAAAFAQTPTAVQNPAAPATVSVQPTTAQAGKPSPNGAKTSAAGLAPKAKAVSVKPAAKPPVSSPKTSTILVGAKTAATSPAAKAVSVHAAAAKPATVNPKVKAVSAQATAAKPAIIGSKAVPMPKSVSVGAVMAKPVIAPATKAASAPHAVSVKVGSESGKPTVAHVMAEPAKLKAVPVKPVARVKAGTSHAKVAVATVAGGSKAAPSVQPGKAAESKPVSEEIRTAGRRDPFVSPVVAMGAIGSGCSAGKRCLTIDQIALKGVVKSESGMIAVVTNAVDKAYFLRENDPVFNGYVVKITGDSIIFKETFHDRLGKSLTRDVTKSITRPVA